MSAEIKKLKFQLKQVENKLIQNNSNNSNNSNLLKLQKQLQEIIHLMEVDFDKKNIKEIKEIKPIKQTQSNPSIQPIQHTQKTFAKGQVVLAKYPKHNRFYKATIENILPFNVYSVLFSSNLQKLNIKLEDIQEFVKDKEKEKEFIKKKEFIEKRIFNKNTNINTTLLTTTTTTTTTTSTQKQQETAHSNTWKTFDSKKLSKNAIVKNKIIEKVATEKQQKFISIGKKMKLAD